MKLSLITALILLLIPLRAANGQQGELACATNENAPPAGAYYWPPDTHVRVYVVRGMFTSAQRHTLLAAMETWTIAATTVGAGVRFKYAGETNGPISCQGCLTVTRREVFKADRNHYAFFNPLQKDRSGLLISAWIEFDFGTISPQALRGFMAHELGHGMGLWDCPTCRKKQTIMNAFPGINKDNGLVEPSPCDMQVVKRVYQLERRLVGNTVIGETGQQ